MQKLLMMTVYCLLIAIMGPGLVAHGSNRLPVGVKNIRVGVIGLGNHMQENILPALQLIPGLELSYACCTNLQKAQEKAFRYKFAQGCVNWKELAEQGLVDAFVVSGPPSLHSEVAEYAIPRGVHVFTEKPYSLNLEQSKQMDGAKNGVFVVGFNFVHTKMHQRLREYREDIQQIKVDISSNKPREPFWGLGSVEESFLYAVGIHGISVVVDLLGEPESVFVSNGKFDYPNFSMQILLKFKNGKTASLDFSNIGSRFVSKIDGLTREGRHFSGDGFRRMQVNQTAEPLIDKKEYILYEESVLAGGYDVTGYRNELQDFFQALSTDKRNEVRAGAAMNYTVHKIISEIVSQLDR